MGEGSSCQFVPHLSSHSTRSRCLPSGCVSQLSLTTRRAQTQAGSNPPGLPRRANYPIVAPHTTQHLLSIDLHDMNVFSTKTFTPP